MSAQLKGLTKILTLFCRTEVKPACSLPFLPESQTKETQPSLMGFRINSEEMPTHTFTAKRSKEH